MRDSFFDIFRGFAILMIVFGHTGVNGGGFVYLFHLSLFFFYAGYFYRSSDGFTFFRKKLKGSIKSYFLYGMILMVFERIFIEGGFLGEGAFYLNRYNFLNALESTLILRCPAMLAGPMWFVPLYLSACLFFNIFMIFKDYLEQKTAGEKNEFSSRYKYIWLYILFSVMVYLLSDSLRRMNIINLWYEDKGLFVVPFFFIGHVFREIHDYASGANEDFSKDRKENESLGIRKASESFGIRKVIESFGIREALILSFFTGLILNSMNNHGIYIDLAAWKTNGIIFYIAGTLGIIHTLSLSRILEKLKFTFPGKIMAFLGRKSFSVMALHIFFFKAGQFIISLVRPEWERSGFPVNVPKNDYRLAVFYTLIGLFGPAVLLWLIEKSRKMAEKINGLH